MNDISSKKLFIGPRLRRLRRELGLTQTRMAEELGVSVSYLNLIERNQRPVTAQLLLRLTEVYDIDLRSLAGEADQRAVVDLSEVLADPLFRELAIPHHEIVEIAANAPALGDAVTRLYKAYLDGKRREENATRHSDGRDEPAAASEDPVDTVRDFVQDQRNHFPVLEEAAEAIAAELMVANADLMTALRERLREKHGLTVRVLPVDVMSTTLRRFDRHRRQLMVSEMLDSSGRIFAIAYLVGQLEAGALMDEIIERAPFTATNTRRLLKVNLTNYMAAAIMMPYGRFFSAADALGYDIQVLGARFGASFEQVCHRLTTLSRPSARGVPFFMIRVDSAGNVSKRFSAANFPFSRYGGTCPLWLLHSTFKNPNHIFTQIVEMPDGARYFTLARAVTRSISSWNKAEPEVALALGCDIKHAAKLVYTRGLDLAAPDATPIGINCRLCERPDCTQRAMLPYSRALVVEEHTRAVAPFRFK
ncbi:helix-turn-helix domain-containing protein [Pseudochelatococcus sp. G4_1912]|uniref:helix-turn-helix domain-containing protein n=1 Tax=Pseudochelatococcus sp. G4_1912 TaxID=3114288 RepID=UPI0039C6A8E8